jgi:hypothetical protein
MILEMRYMDDYIMLWKGPPSLSSGEIEYISVVLEGSAWLRYPLPLEADTSFTFVGVDLLPQLDGTICTRPSTKALGAGTGCMPFYSYVPNSIKRGLVLGAVSRVRAYTRPLDSVEGVLASFKRHLHEGAGYPLFALEKWISEGMCRD